jgi:hypothetical protein
VFRAACSRRRSLLFYPGFRPAVLFANDRNFRQETANWEFVIANVDRIQPAFLVVTVDLTNKTGDTDQIAEYKRINAKVEYPNSHLQRSRQSRRGKRTDTGPAGGVSEELRPGLLFLP